MRNAALDKLRGLAILLMLADHVLELTHTLPLLRYSLTRASMPLFFLISGHLIRRVNVPRLVVVALIGVALPLYAQWLDNPNVLVWYALFAPLILVMSDTRRILVIVFALTWYANKYGILSGTSYTPVALAALLAMGKLIPREWWNARYLPRFTAIVGRYPLTIYVSHILVFESARRYV